MTAAVAVVTFAAFGGTGGAANVHANAAAVCPAAAVDTARCHALVVVDAHGNPNATTSPTGLSPATMKSAYNWSTLGDGTGKTIGIVDAYDDPTAASDLAYFSTQFGLPQANFQKVNQSGGTSYPRKDSGWALEIAMDVEWAHAIAPNAKILLVEAKTNSYSNLMAAEDTAARLGAQYISNSWGGAESSGESTYDSHFRASGVSYFVSAGDNGTPAEYPSSSPNVLSIGGTLLTFNSNGTLASETGWSSGGGGCSLYETATAAQAGFSGYAQAGCNGKRATPDFSLDADPNSGAAVYDTAGYQGQTGWFQVGGTSLSSPMAAGRAAVAGSLVDSAFVYGSSVAWRDITSGNNGAPCLVGFDLCTGRGSWVG